METIIGVSIVRIHFSSINVSAIFSIDILLDLRVTLRIPLVKAIPATGSGGPYGL
jgi:hypothetical protein